MGAREFYGGINDQQRPELAEERTRYRGSGSFGDHAAPRRVRRMD